MGNRYTVTENVEAIPMTKYVNHTETTGEGTKDYSGDKPGFRVIYEDGSRAWYQKEIFDKKFKKIE